MEKKKKKFILLTETTVLYIIGVFLYIQKEIFINKYTILSKNDN